MRELPQEYIMDGESQKQLAQVIEKTTETTLQKQHANVLHETTETTTETTTTTTRTKTLTTKTYVQDEPSTSTQLTDDPSESPARDYMEAKPLQTQMCMQLISNRNQCKKGKGTSWSEYEHRYKFF